MGYERANPEVLAVDRTVDRQLPARLGEQREHHTSHERSQAVGDFIALEGSLNGRGAVALGRLVERVHQQLKRRE